MLGPGVFGLGCGARCEGRGVRGAGCGVWGEWRAVWRHPKYETAIGPAKRLSTGVRGPKKPWLGVGVGVGVEVGVGVGLGVGVGVG